MKCSNCKKPTKIVAKGLCGRCYQHQRRHGGKLPPAEPLLVNRYPHVITFKVSTPMHDALWDVSKMKGIPATEWIRRAIDLALPHDWREDYG